MVALYLGAFAVGWPWYSIRPQGPHFEYLAVEEKMAIIVPPESFQPCS